MRNKLQKVHRVRWLMLVISIAACLPLGGCKLFAPHDKSSDTGKADNTKASRWNGQFRDERALEVERHMSGG
jgi:uncharacterized membrane protein YdfJ with MMPL/SSD domain